MYYVCIENNVVTSIINYAPNVPNTVRVTNISDAEYEAIKNNTHYYDVNKMSVVENLERNIQVEKDKLNSVEREFLNSTDWMILRHLRQKLLNIPTSLTENEYITLEQRRESAARRIV